MDETGRYRVLGGADDGAVRLLDVETYEPVLTAADGHEADVAALHPGYLVEASLDWTTEDPTVADATVVRRTLYEFVDEADPVFEVARETWQDAVAAGESMESRVTRNTDGEVNGVVYVFAETDVPSVFEEFRDGARPLEPLVERVNERRDPAPREVFVLRPLDPAYVVVAITLRKSGQFADTVRDTYDCPRPPEADV